MGSRDRGRRRRALAVNGGLVKGEAALRQRQRVDHGDDTVDGHAGAHLIPGQSKALSSGCGNGRPEVLDDDRIERASSRPSSLSMVGTKSSATVQQMQPLVSSTISPGAQACAAHSSTSSPSKPDIAEFVDDDGNAPAVRLGEQAAQQRGLAGAEKAGDHRDGNAGIDADTSLDVSLEPERQPGRDEDHIVGDAGDRLVEPSLRVAEDAAERRLRHQPEPDLVGHEHQHAGSAAQQPRDRRPVSASMSRPACMRLESHSVRQSTRIARSARASRASISASTSGSSIVCQSPPRRSR